jgi:uracil-DNA glycosylase
VTEKPEHYCGPPLGSDPAAFPLNKMFKRGEGRGRRILIVGQWPAANGWRKSGKAFRTPDGKMLQSGENLNALLKPLDLSLEECAYTDLVKCYRGKGVPPLEKCKSGGWQIFERQLGSEDFGLLILLGPPVWEVVGKKAGTRLRKGKLANIALSGAPYSVLPIWHPVHIYPPSSRENRQIFKENRDELLAWLENSSGAANLG